MTRTTLRWIVVTVLLSSLFVVFGGTADAASPIYVRPGGDDTLCNGTANVDYSGGVAPNCAVQTVAKGVALADSGGSVQVAAGSYSGSVTISKPLTVDGAQAGVDARTRTGAESIIGGVSISSSTVTLDGFSIAAASVQVNGSTGNILSGVTIENDIFDGYTSVGLPTYDAGNILVQQNLFEDAASSSESIQIKASSDLGGCDGSQVLNNSFESATNNGGADVNLSCTDSSSSNITVSDNTTSDNSGGSSFVAFSGVVDGIEVTGNSGTTSGSSVFFFGSVSGTALIDGNDFVSGASSAIALVGGDYTDDTSNTGTFTITGNHLAGNVRGINVAESGLTSPAQMQVHFNEIVGNSTAGIENNSSVTIDATNNWWGCNSGPNTSGCDSTTGSVTGDPWLELTIGANPSTIAPSGYPTADTSTITASLTMNSDGVDTSGSGHVIDGTSVAFATTDGSLASTSGTTVNGSASDTLTASASPSSATVSATVDQQTVSTTVTWQVPANTSQAHVIAVNRTDPRLELNAQVTPRFGASGVLIYDDSSHIMIVSMQVSTVIVSGNEATVLGRALELGPNGIHFVTFRVDVTADEVGGGGTIEVTSSSGFDSGVVHVSEVRM